MRAAAHSRAKICAADALLLRRCVCDKPNCGSSILHGYRDDGGERAGEKQIEIKQRSTMGRKKKEKEPSSEESHEKDKNAVNEAEVESEKRAGRRSSKPVVAKWAVGGNISVFCIFERLTDKTPL